MSVVTGGAAPMETAPEGNMEPPEEESSIASRGTSNILSDSSKLLSEVQHSDGDQGGRENDAYAKASRGVEL